MGDMAQLIVRKLENEVKDKLSRRAKRHGRSVEEEVREILRDATKREGKTSRLLGTEIARLFRAAGLKQGEEIEEGEWRDQGKRAGRPAEVRDTMIAGIVLANRATLATRNTQHFKDLPLTVINPWEI